MEKVKRIVFNVIFYITIIAIIAAILFVMIVVVMKLNVNALTGGDTDRKCVVIDAGHGAEDGGAVSADGLVEKEVNLAIARQLRDYFEVSGWRVIMTRDGDEMCGTGDTFDEKRRGDFAERLRIFNGDADIVISIHQNHFTSPAEHGAQVFYSPNDEKSEVLASCIRRAVKELLQNDNEREITKAGSNIYLLNNCTNPSVLVECGFLSNPEEAELLSLDEYRRQMAFAIYCGAMAAVG